MGLVEPYLYISTKYAAIIFLTDKHTFNEAMF